MAILQFKDKLVIKLTEEPMKDNINIMNFPAASSGVSCWIIISSSPQRRGFIPKKIKLCHSDINVI
jgi:hypothetical protein